MRAVRVMALALIGLLPAASGTAQTASQRCADEVHAKLPGESAVWVVSAIRREDHTELRWESASGSIGRCRMEPDGRISDAAVTGRRDSAPVSSGEFAAEEPFEPYRLTCESEDEGRKECEARPSASVVLVEELSEERCTADLSWGHEEGMVWVDRGCRAVFVVSPLEARIDPHTLSRGVERVGEGPTAMAHPSFRETRARERCREVAGSRGVEVQRIMGSRIEGSSVVVLMEGLAWNQHQQVTCLYDPGTDQAVFAR